MPSLTYNDIEPGMCFRSSGRTLSEADHGLFMMLVGDWHPIHADEIYARATPAGRRLMHGSLGIAIAMGFQTHAVEFADPIVGALGLSDWRFKSPLFIGDTVHVEIKILSKRMTSDNTRYVVDRAIKLVRHDGEVLQEGTAGIMLSLPQR